MASKKYLVGLDLNKNELQNAVIQNLATAPSAPVAGQIYYNTSDNQLYIYNGTRWEVAGNAITSGLLSARPAANTVDAGTIYYATDTYLFYYSNGSTWTQTNAFGSVTAQTSYGASSGNGSATDYARSDHTHGTPALGSATPANVAGVTGSAGSATTPSKEDHVHALVPTANISWATYKITNLGDPTSAQDAATKAYADTMLPKAGGTMSGAIAMGTNKITGLDTPTADADAANKGYVDSVAQGLDVKASVRLATTGALSAYTFTTTAGGTITSNVNGALSIDGVTPSVADRILVKNEVSGNAPYNGIYVVTTVGDAGTPYVLTRSTDANTSAEVTAGMFTFVEQGTSNSDTGWVLTTNNPIVLNTTGLVFAQFSGAGSYTASNGVLLTGSNFTFAPRTGYGLQTGSSGAEIKLATTSGLSLSSDLAVGAGNGISVLTNTVAIDTAVVVSKYAANVGDGAATSYTITHNLGTKDVIVSLFDNSSPYAEVVADIQHTTTSAITLVFSTAPTSNQYRVVVHG
tara:strand:+ start:3184 stop:4743 length:1560 start_codon:yes stop_codon:yes gene_type:complete